MSGDTDDVGSGGPALAGYDYQVDVSIWLALDLILSRRLTDRVLLEPASQEDLEATLADDEQGVVATRSTLDGRDLIVQAKRRDGDAWTVSTLKSLLTKSGPRRVSAAGRLKDSNAHYLLVTSAGLNGRARDLRVRRAGRSPKPSSLPASLIKALPPGSAGRIGVVGGLDDQRLLEEIQRLLVERLRVPFADWAACLRDLRDAARLRMKGAAGGEWRREDLQAVIAAHDGYLATERLMDIYVHPTNWSALKAQLRDRHAALIIGQSGTGKTEATNKLYEELLAEHPGLKRVRIRLGPEQLRDDRTPGPVLYDVEDPWGRIDFDPDKRPWNDQLAGFFAKASAQRPIIATTRRDVIQTAGALPAMSGWLFPLEAEHYGPAERSRLYRTRIDGLPRHLQALASKSEAWVLRELASPLEIQKFFDGLHGLHQEGDEAGHGVVAKAIRRAHQGAIEATVAGQVEQRGDVRAAAVVWALLKVADKVSLRHLPAIEDALFDSDARFERGVQPLVDAFVAARNLRVVGGDASYYHPRVEAGIEQALMRDRLAARSALRSLAAVLVSSKSPDPKWGAGAAARIIAAASGKGGLAFGPPERAAEKIDDWLGETLTTEGPGFAENLRLAAVAGSSESTVAEMARHLLHRPDKRFGFFHVWAKPEQPRAWYKRLKADPAVRIVARRFVREFLPDSHDRYPPGLHDELARLAGDLTSDFMATASRVVGWGHIHNDDAIAAGALQDLDGFEAIVDDAVAVRTPTEVERRRWADQNLDIDNGVYSDDYADHLMDSDDGHTAGEMLEAYVARIRATKGWQYLSQHRHAGKLRHYWLRDVGGQAKDNPLDAGEVAGLFSACHGTSDEDRFWFIARRAWDDRYLPPLLARLRSHDDPDAHHAALACLIKVAPGKLGPLVEVLLDDARPEVVAAIALDLGVMSDRNDQSPFGPEASPHHGEQVSRALAALPPAYAAMADAAIALRKQEVPELSQASLAVLVPLSGGSLAVRQFRIAVSAHHDLPVDDAIRWVIEHADRDGPAVDAMEAAVRRGMVGEYDAALDHRFARVSAIALRALGALTPSPLPARFLAKSDDRSSFIKRALVDVLVSKPHPGHVETLLRMAGDQWSSDTRRYGEDDAEHYPIAEAAIAALALHTPLPAEASESLYQIAIGTPDPQVRKAIFDLLAPIDKRWQDRLLDLANDPGRSQVRRAAAQALLDAHKSVSAEFAGRITPEILRVRGTGIAVRLAILFALRADPDAVVDAAKALAGRAQRRVLLLLFIRALSVRGDAKAADAVSLFLPHEHPGAALARDAASGPLDEAAIKDLGEAVICQEVLRWLNPPILEED